GGRRRSGPSGAGARAARSPNPPKGAVRIPPPRGGVAGQQRDEKTKQKKKPRALRVRRARLYDAERTRREAERAAARKSQVGSGDRSDKVRTYNFPQNRGTDHRINLTLYNIDRVMAGELHEVIQALIQHDQPTRLPSRS